MKKILFPVFFFSLIITQCFAQAGMWTWMKGDSVPGSPGVFGTQGVASSLNTPPCMYEGCEWTDLPGNFWLFGGESSLGSIFNALWKFDPSLNQWTWMKGPSGPNDAGSYGTMGVPSAFNNPPSRGRGVATWVDLNGDLWLFGGYGASVSYSDLWRYQISSNEWTWMKGPDSVNQPGYYGTQGQESSLNYPRARWETNASWVDDSGNLWLFGGYAGACLNDLWKYDPNTNNWTWMKGSSSVNQAGVYGTLGVEDSLNNPGSRLIYSKWKDADGNFWLFGGLDYCTTSQCFNDMWKYNVSTNNWTWMAGTDVLGSNGFYGDKCIAVSTNIPSSRYENRMSWVDSCGKFWLFGGRKAYSNGNGLNDLWKFDPVTNLFMYVSGDSLPYQNGFYGTQTVANINNLPASHLGSVSWIDMSGNLWFFGGPRSWGNAYLNDLWKYAPDTSCGGCASPVQSFIQFAASQSVICQSTCIDFIDNSTNNPASWQWLFSGGVPSTSTLQNPITICYDTSGTYDVTLITTNANGTDTLTLYDYIIVNALPSAPLITQNNDTLTSSPANSYQWYYSGVIIPAATNQEVVITQGGEYSVVITNSSGCTATDTILVVLMLPESNFSSGEIAGCPESCFDFTNSSLNATMYEWFFPGGNPSSSSQQNPSNICYANPGIYDVTLIASSNFASDTLTAPGYITIFLPLAVTISQNGNFLTCNPAAFTYQWYFNAIAIPGATNQTTYINQQGDYSVAVSDSNGCASSASINVQNVPSPAFSSPDTSVCEKFCVNFFDESTNNPTAWQWIFPGGSPSSSTLQNPIDICYNSPGLFDVTLITTNVYGNDTLTLSNYITVYATPPFPSITQVGYTLTSSPATSYQWQLNSADIPGATDQSYTVLQSGYYAVVVGDSNGSKNSVSTYILISGISDESDPGISIYPNPTSHGLMVEWLNGLVGDEITISILNALGQEIFSFQQSRSIGTSIQWKKEIDLQNIVNGVYFIEILAESCGKSQNVFLKKKIIIAK